MKMVTGMLSTILTSVHGMILVMINPTKKLPISIAIQ